MSLRAYNYRVAINIRRDRGSGIEGPRIAPCMHHRRAALAHCVRVPKVAMMQQDKMDLVLT